MGRFMISSIDATQVRAFGISFESVRLAAPCEDIDLCTARALFVSHLFRRLGCEAELQGLKF